MGRIESDMRSLTELQIEPGIMAELATERHNGKTPLLRITSAGVELVGWRKVYWIDGKRDRYAWTTLEGSQVRVTAVPLSSHGMGAAAVINIQKEPLFACPYPLATRKDAEAFPRHGLSGDRNAKQWAKRLGWKGYGACAAAQSLRDRWQRFAQGGDGTKVDCPSVVFPAFQPEPAPEGMTQRVAELERRLTAIESRLAILEFVP